MQSFLGTAHSILKHNYGAGHLFRELVEGKEVDVSVVTNEDETIESQVKLEDMPFAKLYSTRHAFKNYAAFVNASDKPVNTIFHATQFSPDMHGATLSGCGEINPVQNDPKMEDYRNRYTCTNERSRRLRYRRRYTQQS